MMLPHKNKTKLFVCASPLTCGSRFVRKSSRIFFSIISLAPILFFNRAKSQHPPFLISLPHLKHRIPNTKSHDRHCMHAIRYHPRIISFFLTIHNGRCTFRPPT